MRRLVIVLPLLAALLSAGGCLATPGATTADPSEKYTINLQRPNQMLTGRPVRNLIAGANLNPGEIQGVLDANPGLREALVRNGVDLSRLTGLRISPTNVVDVFYDG